MLQSLLARVRGANDDEKGFTLIELLVVILIIGILAAIALPTFLGQQDKAKDSSAKSDARNAVTQVESCLADGTAVATCTDKTTNPDLAQFKDRVTFSTPATGEVYHLTATASNGHTYDIAKKSAGGYTYSSGSGATGGPAWAANSSS